MAKWICRVHGQGFTIEVPCDTEVDAEAEAFQYISRGIRDGNRIYPNTSVVFCELIEKENE